MTAEGETSRARQRSMRSPTRASTRVRWWTVKADSGRWSNSPGCVLCATAGCTSWTPGAASADVSVTDVVRVVISPLDGGCRGPTLEPAGESVGAIIAESPCWIKHGLSGRSAGPAVEFRAGGVLSGAAEVAGPRCGGCRLLAPLARYYRAGVAVLSITQYVVSGRFL